MLKKLLAVVAMLFAAASFAAVDVNKATAAELDAIKGIGPGISGKILDERKKGNFKDWNDFIERVKGVGEANAAKFSSEGLTVGGAAFKGVAAAAKKDDKPAAAAAKDEKPAAAAGKDAKPAAAAAAAPAKDEKKDPKAAAKEKADAEKKAKADEKAKKADEAKAKAAADKKAKDDAKAAKDAKPAAKDDKKEAKAEAAKPAASAAKK